MDQVNWGIIGCGDVTEIKSGPAFNKVNGSKLIAVMRRNKTLAQDYANRHNVPKWYADANELINDPEINAIYIATPPANHKEYTIMAAEAGKPVYVEKPMALNVNECEEMISICKTRGVKLFVAYYRRALDRFLKIKELIETNVIGNVRLVSIKFYDTLKESPNNLPWRVDPKIAGGGHFIDLASHMLDFLDFLFGPITTVKGIASNQAGLYEAEDIVSGTFKFENGIHCCGNWCFSAFERVDRTEIIGDKGKIVYSTFDAEPIKLITKNDIHEFKIDYPKNIQHSLIKMVVDDILGIGHCPSTGDTAIRTTYVMEEMIRNYYSTK
ncbi:MAG: Gfo/Idh/MocA family oxidoreductase [Melioribacteraceae bacterium]|nr:Gfo/Idh/MocA family oxidoreductase [Melioribacteraceae bacterium]